MRRQYYVDLGRMLRNANKDVPQFGTTKLQEAYDEIQEDIKSRNPGNFSLKQLFIHTVEDGNQLIEEFNPSHENDINFMEAGGSSQAVSTQDFSNITGQIFFTMAKESFENPMFIHGQLMNDQPTVLNGEKIPGISKIGDLSEAIGEGDPYPRMKPSEEYIETPQTTKRGGVVEVTKEALFFDRTGVLLDRCSSLGDVIGFNKEKRCIDLALGITNSYKYNGTAIDTYGDSSGNHNWDNLAASNALADWTDIETAELLFDAMTDPITGEPIMLRGRQVVVPTALLHTARRILSATEINYGLDNGGVTTAVNTTRTSSPNPLAGSGYEIVSNAYVKARTTSATTWYVGDFKRAFVYMENWGLTAAKLGANSHMDFDRDVVAAYKVSERGVPAVKEPRYVVKATA